MQKDDDCLVAHAEGSYSVLLKYFHTGVVNKSTAYTLCSAYEETRKSLNTFIFWNSSSREKQNFIKQKLLNLITSVMLMSKWLLFTREERWREKEGEKKVRIPIAKN